MKYNDQRFSDAIKVARAIHDGSIDRPVVETTKTPSAVDVARLIHQENTSNTIFESIDTEGRCRTCGNKTIDHIIGQGCPTNSLNEARVGTSPYELVDDVKMTDLGDQKTFADRWNGTHNYYREQFAKEPLTDANRAWLPGAQKRQLQASLKSIQRERDKKGVVYVWPKGESLADNLVNRHDRPHEFYAQHVPEILSKVGIDPNTKVKWSVKAGCKMCPCSPGFVIQDDKHRGKSIHAHVTITPQSFKKRFGVTPEEHLDINKENNA